MSIGAGSLGGVSVGIGTDATPLLFSGEAYLVPWLPEFWFGVVAFTLAAYVLLDGFDFGIGILYPLSRNEHERETLLSVFGPVWDANEVWLVAFGTVLLGAFPPVYARLLSDNYLLAIAIVLALLFRGVSAELREQRDDEDWKRIWDLSFVAGSVLSPFLIGMLVGSWLFASGAASLPSLLVGVLVVALSATLGSAYLGLKTRGDLRERFARHGRNAAVVYLGAVVVGLAVLLAIDAGNLRSAAFTASVLAPVLATVAFGIATPVFAQRRAFRAWFVAAAGLAASLAGLVAALLYPTIYPLANLTVREAVVSPIPLNLLTVLGVPALLMVLAYFTYLYRVFQGPVAVGGDGGYGVGDD
ncbi:MAG: cytochrome d ubiquinol oxidase subunit II [Haloferacaceae archaeon]